MKIMGMVFLAAVMLLAIPHPSFAAACSAGDTDGDGIDDIAEDIDSSGDCDDDDLDGDGIADYLDIDDDGDSIPTAAETADDPDGDGLPNYLDRDSDNDTIPDLVEANGSDVSPLGIDGDGDGLDDRWDIDATGGTPAAIPDSDGDGLVDMLDQDSDNDTIPDIVDLERLDQHVLIADADGPYTLLDGLNLTLDASGSFTSDGLPIVAYDWDIGADGNYDFSSPDPLLELSISDIAFLSLPGKYNIDLRVTDDAGFVDFDSTTLIASVSEIPLPATLWLFATALLGLSGVGKWRNST